MNKITGVLVGFLVVCSGTAQALFETCRTKRPDGTTITFYLDRVSGPVKRPVCFILQGSGKNSVMPDPTGVPYGFGSQFRLERIRDRVLALVRKFACSLVLIEKPGINGLACKDDEFNSMYTIEQRAQDVISVVDDIKLRLDAVWDGSIVMVGGSEGGDVAALALPFMPKTMGAIILSSASMWPMSRVLAQALRPQGSGWFAELKQSSFDLYVKAQFGIMRRFPTSKLFWHGLSYKYWSGLIDYANGPDLLKASCPLLVLHGTLDNTVPLQACMAFVKEAEKQNKPHIKIRVYEGLDQGLLDQDGVVPDQVITDLETWLTDQGLERVK